MMSIADLDFLRFLFSGTDFSWDEALIAAMQQVQTTSAHLHALYSYCKPPLLKREADRGRYDPCVHVVSEQELNCGFSGGG